MIESRMNSSRSTRVINAFDSPVRDILYYTVFTFKFARLGVLDRSMRFILVGRIVSQLLAPLIPAVPPTSTATATVHCDPQASRTGPRGAKAAATTDSSPTMRTHRARRSRCSSEDSSHVATGVQPQLAVLRARIRVGPVDPDTSHSETTPALRLALPTAAPLTAWGSTPTATRTVHYQSIWTSSTPSSRNTFRNNRRALTITDGYMIFVFLQF